MPRVSFLRPRQSRLCHRQICSIVRQTRVQSFVCFIHGACEGRRKSIGVSRPGIIFQIALHKYPVEPEFSYGSKSSRQSEGCNETPCWHVCSNCPVFPLGHSQKVRHSRENRCGFHHRNNTYLGPLKNPCSGLAASNGTPDAVGSAWNFAVLKPKLATSMTSPTPVAYLIPCVAQNAGSFSFFDRGRF